MQFPLPLPWHSPALGIGLSLLLGFASPTHSAELMNIVTAEYPDLGDRFGASVLRTQGKIFIGAPNEQDSRSDGDGSDNSLMGAGAAYMLDLNSGDMQILKSPNPQEGAGFGSNFCLRHTSQVAISEPGYVDPDSGRRGAIHIFLINSWSSKNNATYEKTLLLPEGELGQMTGISGSGGDLLVGTDSDTIYIFDVYGNETPLRIKGPANSGFGSSGLFMHYQLALVGAPREGGGVVYAYQWQTGGGLREGQWILQQRITPTNSEKGDQFGASISALGLRIIVGAPGEDGGWSVIDGDGTDNSAPDSGAAFAFIDVSDNGEIKWRQEAYLKPPNVTPGAKLGSAVTFANNIAMVSSTEGVDIFLRESLEAIDDAPEAIKWLYGERIPTSSCNPNLFPSTAIELGIGANRRSDRFSIPVGYEDGNGGTGSTHIVFIDTKPEIEQAAIQPGGELEVGQWAQRVDASIDEWNSMSFIQKRGSAINRDFVNIGDGWWWGSVQFQEFGGGRTKYSTYFYIEEPFIWDDTKQTWLYTESDDSGVYYYDYSQETWSWRSRDGNSAKVLD